MDYKEASKIRKKSFGTLLAEHEGGLGSSLKAAISQRTQARMTGLQEKFDPMNIAKFMTLGSNWAPAMLGKLTGRKQSSIDYFSGVKGRHKGTAEKLAAESVEGGDLLGILHSIESLLHKTREDDKLKSEEDKNFEEERNLEKQNRHKELIAAITGKPYTKTVPKTATKEEDDDKTPWMDWLEGLGWLKYLLLGPVSGLTALLAGIGLGAWLLQKLADNTANMKAMSPEEAANVLRSGSPGDIEAAGGKEALEDIIKTGKQKAKEALAMPAGEARDKRLLEMGGEDKVKKISEAKDEEIPVTSGVEGMAKKVTPREVFAGTGSARASKLAKWDRKFGPYYNEDGTLKSATPMKSSPVESAPKQEAPKNSSATETKLDVASVTPTETPNAGQALNQVQKTNLDLSIPTTTSSTPAVINSSVNNMTKSGRKRSNIPMVRNSEETLQRMILNSTRVV